MVDNNWNYRLSPNPLPSPRGVPAAVGPCHSVNDQCGRFVEGPAAYVRTLEQTRGACACLICLSNWGVSLRGSRYRVCADRVRNHFIDAFRIQRHLTDSQRPPHFDQFADTHDILGGRGLSEKVDGETRCDRQRHNSDLAEDGHIESNIRERHEYRPGHRSSRSQLVSSDWMLHGGRRVTDCLNDALGLREVARYEFDDLGFGRHA